MTGHGQFCSLARANEVLGGRWTLLVVRELLSGSRRFNDIRRGIPRISRTMLSERLQSLAAAGIATRVDGEQGLCVSGPQALRRRFPEWFHRYLFAGTAAVHDHQ